MNDAARRAGRADAGGGGRTGPRVAEGARPAREARELPPRGRHLRALPAPDRAARLAPVVVCHGGACPARDRGPARTARPLPPAVAARLRAPLARGDPRLEHLAPALVGAPAAALVLPRTASHVHVAAARRLRGGGSGSSGATPTCSTRGSRPRSGRSRRSAGREESRRAPSLLPRRPQLDGARDHPPLGEPDDLVRVSS